MFSALDRSDPTAFVRQATIVSVPRLVPELQLRLVTEACALWRATEKDLDRIGLDPPYWAFAWPGGQALARYIFDHPTELAGRYVFDFGAGGGIEAIAAAKVGAAKVLASDLDPLAVAAISENASLNAVPIEVTTRNYLGEIGDWDVVLAGDVFYDAAFADRVMEWFSTLKSRVLIGDPGRGRIDPKRVVELAAYDAPGDIDVDGSITKRTSVFEVVR